MRRIELILFLFLSMHLQAVTLQLKSTVNIKQNSIFLSEVVDLINLDQKLVTDISEIQIGEIAKNKNFINISNKQIVEALRSNNREDIKINGPLVSVYKEQKMLSEEEIKYEIVKYLNSQMSLSQNVEIELLRVPQIKQPDQEYKLEFFTPDLKPNTGRLILIGKLISENQKLEEFSINIKIYDIYEVYQLKNSVKQGMRFTANNLSKIYVKEILSNKYNICYQEILESVSASYLPKGKLLNMDDIKSEPLVCKADIVDVVIQGKYFKMNYKALAKNNAWIGEQVTLQNIDTKKCFNARVIAKNTVLIDLEEQ